MGSRLGRRQVGLGAALAACLLAGCGSGGTGDGVEPAAAAERYTVVDRTPPARFPVADLLEYLHLEFGEFADEPGALKAEDLVYFGTLRFDDRVEYIWKFPCSTPTGCWLRVTERPAHTVTGWDATPPPGA
ncbi:hypothetical protein [Pseudoxanthomonas suwonensis]|uniref:hypothetical protein n=1 Tax=Pseudoxanthomonas suwonensis TaxID=314722 RepID=UPI00046737A2|nr:hypothetical protein [Pseudoxanthomonas suwonensis]